jgi:hypothetical protein
MNFEWDERKREENIRKHGVDFADAVAALQDDMAYIVEDKNYTEEPLCHLGNGLSWSYSGGCLHVPEVGHNPHHFSSKGNHERAEAIRGVDS